MAKAKLRVTITVNEEFCKGCALCVEICPQDALDLAEGMNSRGIHPALLARPDDCTGCTQCAVMCPDACLRIERLA